MSETGLDIDALEAKYREEREKRLTADRGQFLLMEGALRRYGDDPYTRPEPREPRAQTVKVLVVGAGFGGLIMAARLRDAGIDDFLLVDEAGDVGGVWYWNRYPGASCDIDAYTYLPLLEETGYMPTMRYCSQEEIYGYARLLAKRYGVYDRALFHTAVRVMRWDDGAGQWVVTTDRGDVIRAQFVVTAIGGAYSRPKLPTIEGVDAFEGVSFHTSRWNYDYTGGGPGQELAGLGDKTVAIIGTGATALQCVPWLARSAKKLYVVQRTPNAVGPRPNPPTDPEWFKDLPRGWQMARFENFALQTSGVPVDEDLIQDGWSAIFYELIKPGQDQSLSPEERAAAAKVADLRKMDKLRDRVDEIVADPALARRLKPYYHYLCKRPGFHDEYLQCFNRPNVELVDTEGRGLKRITPTGFVADGVEYEVDCIIHATGFLTADDPYTTRAGFEVIGAGGRSLGEKWKDGPETFHGVTSHGFPNLLIFPDASQQAVTSFNFMHTLIESSAHAAYVIGELDKRGVDYFDVDPEAERNWVAAVMEHSHDRDAFYNACTPGRYSNEGHVAERSAKAASYPLKTMDFFALWNAWRDAGELTGLELHSRSTR